MTVDHAEGAPASQAAHLQRALQPAVVYGWRKRGAGQPAGQRGAGADRARAVRGGAVGRDVCQPPQLRPGAQRGIARHVPAQRGAPDRDLLTGRLSVYLHSSACLLQGTIVGAQESRTLPAAAKAPQPLL